MCRRLMFSDFVISIGGLRSSRAASSGKQSLIELTLPPAQFSSSSVVEIYTCFVNNWNKAKNAIRQASAAKPAFARFLETMAREHKGKLSLDNLLIKPVQKFPK